MSLPTIGTVSYNGVVFGHFVRTHVRSEAVYDNARPNGRMVKHVKYTFNIVSEVSDPAIGQTTDAVMTSLRSKLEAPGKEFRYEKRGFGDFHVNAPGGASWDVAWGPKPKMLSYTPIGSVNTALVEWQVEVCIPECSKSVTQFRLMSAVYEVNFAIDQHGYHVVTTSGSIEIPLTFRNGERLVDQADAYRELAVPPVPNKFQREQHFKLSEDRSRLDFTIVDKEMPIGLPHGVTMCDLKHQVESGLTQGAFRSWSCVIHGTVRMNPAIGHGRADSWDRFYRVFVRRLPTSRQIERGDCKTNLHPVFSVIVIKKLQVVENIFGDDSHFRVEFDLIGVKLEHILHVAGLWTTVTNGHRVWGRSVQDTAHNPRGNLRLRYNGQQDVLIDLCSRGARTAVGVVDGGGGVNIGGDQAADPNDPAGTDVTAAFADANPSQLLPPDPQNGNDGANWLMFECAVTVDEEDHVIRHKPLAGETREKPSAANALGTVEELNANLGSPDMGVSTTVPDIIQRVAAPSQTLILEGRAVRIGCEIDPPVLVRLGGANFVQAGKRVKRGTLSTSINGQAVHYTLWRIEYLLDQPIGRIPLPANPFIGQDGADYR